MVALGHPLALVEATFVDQLTAAPLPQNLNAEETTAPGQRSSISKARKRKGRPGSEEMAKYGVSKSLEKIFCPFPGCKRSFGAGLWRLKLHYRAPPDCRGSGVERGHGIELIRCPRCNISLQRVRRKDLCACFRMSGGDQGADTSTGTDTNLSASDSGGSADDRPGVAKGKATLSAPTSEAPSSPESPSSHVPSFRDQTAPASAALAIAAEPCSSLSASRNDPRTPRQHQAEQQLRSRVETISSLAGIMSVVASTEADMPSVQLQEAQTTLGPPSQFASGSLSDVSRQRDQISAFRPGADASIGVPRPDPSGTMNRQAQLSNSLSVQPEFPSLYGPCDIFCEPDGSGYVKQEFPIQLPFGSAPGSSAGMGLNMAPQSASAPGVGCGMNVLMECNSLMDQAFVWEELATSSGDGSGCKEVHEQRRRDTASMVPTSFQRQHSYHQASFSSGPFPGESNNWICDFRHGHCYQSIMTPLQAPAGTSWGHHTNPSINPGGVWGQGNSRVYSSPSSPNTSPWHGWRNASNTAESPEQPTQLGMNQPLMPANGSTEIRHVGAPGSWMLPFYVQQP